MPHDWSHEHGYALGAVEDGKVGVTTTNLRVAEEAASLLRDSGTAELKYLTAEFEPFSSSQRPDLIYSPGVGPNAGRLFVVEMRVKLPAHGRLPMLRALVEHRRFLQDDLGDSYFYFGVATEKATIDAGDVAALAVEGVIILDGVGSGEALAEAVRQWSARAEPPPGP